MIKLYLAATILLCVLVVSFILGITAIRPSIDNMPLIVIVVGIMGPIITALVAASVYQVYHAVNSRLTELLELTRVTSKEEGKLEQKVTQKITDELTKKEVDPVIIEKVINAQKV